MKHVALLRGVNVGGKNSLPMADLAAMFTAAGCTEVRTYIQSGNVVFVAKAAVAARVPTVVAAAIEKRFGFQSPVVVRTADALRLVGEKNPFLSSRVDTTRLHVAFLADAATAARVATLDPKRSPPDAFRVAKDRRELYLHFPNGAGKTKLTNVYLDKTLGTVSTMRNWNTVTKLIELVT
jgi:uncharacterized protein (DUF1697 family)